MKDTPRTVFDGFVERQYSEEIDGWIKCQPDIDDFPSMLIANDIYKMFQEIQHLRRENWELKKELKLYRRYVD